MRIPNVVAATLGILLVHLSGPAFAFPVEEASIQGIQAGIQSGKTTCRQVVQAYIDRAKAYNGVCTALVTKDGMPVQSRLGTVRAGSPLKFSSATVAISRILPDFDKYKGLPIEYGRLDPTRSDPTVVQQYGMVTAIPNAGQVNALSTLNIRGERSVTCKGAFDAPPGKPLPAGAPAVCEKFRQLPDALEYAASLDKKYGRHPNLKAMPMYCAVFSFKDVYDTKDMRSTGGADTNYAMDAPPQDATVVAELRAKGAIIYAKATLQEYNAAPSNPAVPNAAKVKTRTYGVSQRSSWGSVSCNPYDTERETGGSSSGSAVSVAANLATCSLCEETGGSCRQPAWRNNIVALMTTKGMIPYGGAIGSDPYLDRAGIQCRSIKDAAAVLDAIKNPVRGYFDPRDIYSALPKSLISKAPYGSFVGTKAAKGAKPLAGLRIGIVREFMVKHTANDAAISDLADAEIKKVLRDQLGAQIVESYDPNYPDDPGVPNMTYTFQRALAEILPIHMPEYFTSKVGDIMGGGEDGGEGGGGGDGTAKPPSKLAFGVDGFDIGSRDYIAKLSENKAPLSDELNIRRISASPRIHSFGFHMEQYLLRRGDARVKDWPSLVANSKHFNEAHAVAMLNTSNKLDIASPGMTQRVKMREVMRLVIDKVMQENRIDVLVNPTITIPPVLNGGAAQPAINGRPQGRFPLSADVGIPEITVPAGFNSVMYEPKFQLNDKQDAYRTVANNTDRTTMKNPMPYGLSFWAGAGEEPMVIKVASIYEQASKHRMAPPAFGPVTKK